MIIPDIPDKKYFTIGQVSRLLGVKPHILRYWEQEFPVLKPRKTSKGRRVFVRKDIEIIARIHDLLYAQKFTLEGARQRLTDEERNTPIPLFEGRRFALKKIQKIKQDLRDLLKDIEEGSL